MPPYCSFGGEGTPYMQHLIPTVAFIAAPWTLFSSGYGLEQIDFGLLRKQTLQFADVLLGVRGASQAKIAGKRRYRSTAQDRATRGARGSHPRTPADVWPAGRKMLGV